MGERGEGGDRELPSSGKGPNILFKVPNHGGLLSIAAVYAKGGGGFPPREYPFCRGVLDIITPSPHPLTCDAGRRMPYTHA